MYTDSVHPGGEPMRDGLAKVHIDPLHTDPAFLVPRKALCFENSEEAQTPQYLCYGV